MSSNQEVPIKNLPGVGLSTLKKLERLKIKTVKDLLFHFPHRYEDFSNSKNISELAIGENATICGEILTIKNTRTWKKRMDITEAVVADSSGSVKAVWFNQPYLARSLRPKTVVSFSGKLTVSASNICFSNPAYEILGFGKTRENFLDRPTLHTRGFIPIYPETQGVSSRWLRIMIKSLLKVSKNCQEILPKEVLENNNLPSIGFALEQIHFPASLANANRAKQRFAFEELFLLQLFVQRQRLELKSNTAPIVKYDENIVKKFVSSLPFELTPDQRKSAWQIIQDLGRSCPMNRLLQGDVGSGKTIVATIAALNCAANKMQTAFMAPTEILSRQHFEKIWPALAPLGIKVGLLTSRQAVLNGKEISKKELIREMKSGEAQVVIGTHSLIQKGVVFKNLVLVIIDEQHRFGVEQRASLLKNPQTKAVPHLLSMSATPIPRTLTLTVWGDLDISVLKEMPKGRKPIVTRVVPPASREKAYHFIKNEIQQGRQAFVICPLIDESQILEVKSVTQEFEKISKKIFPDLKVGLLHGKIKTRQRETMMNNLSKNEINILVATSVVEVGIDVPNATIMMIEDADRFGLASLYQFRGRVGRGEHQSYCFLFTNSPSKKTAARLKAITAAKNGFELAQKDLEIRGPGDFVGVRQSGLPDLAMASLNDIDLVEKTREAARAILRKDPNLKTFPALAEKVLEFKKRVHFE